MDTSLNADAALRTHLSPESWNGEAQHRFVFRAPDGDEEVLLARLETIHAYFGTERTYHHVLIRPENAELRRVFVLSDYWIFPHPYDISLQLSLQEALRFDWQTFENLFNEPEFDQPLERIWLKRHNGHDLIFSIGSEGRGQIDGYIDNRLGDYIHPEFFCLRQTSRASVSKKNLHFLRWPDEDFRRHMDALFNIPNGEIQKCLKWRFIPDKERDRIAFKCQNGRWEDALEIAALALQVRLGTLNLQTEDACQWHFTAQEEIQIRIGNRDNVAELRDDKFLSLWRAAIVKVFKPENINADGVMGEDRSQHICLQIEGSARRFVNAPAFSGHELMDAHMKLRQWTKKHLPPDQAERLLAP